MGLTPVVIEQFPGLDLRTDPGDSRGALDALNVTFEAGKVRTRHGTGAGFSPASNNTIYFMAPFNGGSLSSPQQIIVTAGAPAAVYAINGGGGLPGAATTINTCANTGCSGVSIGTPAGSFFYLINSSSALRRYDGLLWTAPGISPAQVNCLGVSPTDNRMVTCSGSAAGSKTWFSNAGAPETFSANDFVYLTPGDGEEIQGTAVFNNQLFVFKESKFFVFYGNSIDATGNSIFNYRVIDTGIGMRQPCPQSVCVGPDGAYFLGQDGIYRTTGGPPVKISGGPIDPFFNGGAHTYWQGGTWDETFNLSRLCWFEDCLYASLATSSTTGLTLVWDSKLNVWSAWSLYSGAISVWKRGASTFVRTLVLTTDAVGTVTDSMLYVDSTLSVPSDNGTNILSRYRLPFESYGSPLQKRIRETLIEGTGSPVIQWSRDWSTPVTGGAVTLGTAPTPGIGRQRSAIRGRTFSLSAGKTSGAWTINRVQANVSDSLRKPEVSV